MHVFYYRTVLRLTWGVLETLLPADVTVYLPGSDSLFCPCVRVHNRIRKAHQWSAPPKMYQMIYGKTS